ncbi:hypothetical protein [Streptomyces sp. VRA16 Mangrove soil]|uniref:hypothetical protein n=1 Tax=Streptomyces sp. VRA16 Mangrove soil TaxID=2817434 RepID=UPI001A9CCAA7|nr:hypothetical protein [Streptomyces sp. VRA16 Mangrove soil]MBO1330385.1 hypothetical protein [Streptomyces sp. VRA16 Mangrove soil]
MGSSGAPDRTGRLPRRSWLGAAVAAGVTGLAGCGSADTAQDTPRRSRTALPARSSSPTASPRPTRRRPELPRGGRRVFPEHRLVGYCGLPGAAALGRLGTGMYE